MAARSRAQGRRAGAVVLASALMLAAAGCADTVPSSPPSTPASSSLSPSEPGMTPSPAPTKGPAATPDACRSTDQDRYVYHPARLQVLAACIRVTGTVAFIREEADGDLHIGLALDTAFEHLVVATNQGAEQGDLVIEPVCELRVTQTDAIAICATDRDPFRGLPTLGEHVWMEGRRELHPLYRWGAP
jgi:hypothetical protein